VLLWSSHNRKDVITLETVEGRFTRMLPGLESFSYEERLVWLFFSLLWSTDGWRGRGCSGWWWGVLSGGGGT